MQPSLILRSALSMAPPGFPASTNDERPPPATIRTRGAFRNDERRTPPNGDHANPRRV